jgi:hypothetical protein
LAPPGEAQRRAALARPIPEGHHSVTPYLSVSNAGEALDWYTRALGATEVMRLDHELQRRMDQFMKTETPAQPQPA